MHRINKWSYQEHDLIGIISKVYNVSKDQLSKIHLHRKDLYLDDPVRNSDGTTEWIDEASTKFHKQFYNFMNSDRSSNFYQWYKNFIYNDVSPWFSESFVYQKSPSFRIHLPDLQAISKWHFDSDDDHRHPLWEINFHVAVTDIFETNSVWIETIPGLKDFTPVEMKKGHYTIFDGNRCTHGNKLNTTGNTRISFDFRVMPISRYNKISPLVSATTNKKFIIGEYYDLFTK